VTLRRKARPTLRVSLDMRLIDYSYYGAGSEKIRLRSAL
jgi:hypothetical protein